MPDLKAILADKTAYADNLALQLGNGVTVSLGQIRSLSAEDQKAITDAEKKIADREASLAAEQAKLTRAQVETANAYELTQRATNAIKNGQLDDPAVRQLFGDTLPKGVGSPNNDPFAELARLENDALLGPLVRLAKAQNAKLADAEAKLAANEIGRAHV